MFRTDLIDLIEAQQQDNRGRLAFVEKRLKNARSDYEFLDVHKRGVIGRIKEHYHPLGSIIPQIPSILYDDLLKYDMVVKTNKMLDVDYRYPRTTFKEVMVKQFKSNYIDLVSAENTGDFAKILAENAHYRDVLNTIFNEEGKITMPVIFNYFSGVDETGGSWTHNIMLLRKPSLRGTTIELFDPNGSIVDGVVRQDINYYITNAMFGKRDAKTNLEWRFQFNESKPLQRSEGVQCARLCWLRWYTYNNGFDGAPAASFYNLDGFIDYFTKHFKSHEEIEKAAVATMMAEGIDDEVVDSMLEINTKKIADLEKYIKKGRQLEEDLARKHEKETKAAKAKKVAQSSSDDVEDDELAAFLEVPVMGGAGAADDA